MDETLIVDRIGWCRADAHHRYVGALWGADDRIRLVGRDATFGIEVSLAIPVGEIDHVDIELGHPEPSLGKPCIVVTLAGSAPILVWAVGADHAPLDEIGARLAALRGARESALSRRHQRRIRQKELAMKVQDVMTSPVHSVGTGATLKDVARLLGEYGISGLPVVDDSGELVGIVSKADILIKESPEAPVRRREFGGLRGLLCGSGEPPLSHKIDARTAGEAMTSPALSIEPGRSIAAAASLMLNSRINRVPVLEHGKLVGIVSRSDLVRAFTRPDADIEREVREEVLKGVFWLMPTAIEVEVKAGEVTLRGDLETRTDAELIPTFARKVIGVVGVESHLTWRIDGRAEFERRGA